MRPKPLFRFFPVQALSLALTLSALNAFAALPPLPPFPPLPAPQPVDSVPMADSKSAPEVKLDLPITPGPYAPTWESIERNYPGTPAWLRDAKFGIWVHFGPQAAGQSGDWYARNLYKPGSTAYKNHLANYGHPSEVGYKEVLRDWNPDKLDPAKLVELYKDAGARYLIIQGVHHDEFDMWDSKYQPWNSTRLGPKRDLLGEWTKAARAADIRFGVTFHHEYSWWWWQTAFGSDKDGPKAGIPYDGHLTLADGKGKWWEGLDPRLLYGVDLREYKGVVGAANHAWNPPPAGIFQNHAAYAKWYATWWALRMMDVVDKYQPDFIYTDGTNTQPFSGAGTGTGQKSDAMQRVIADFYNKTLQRRGKVDVFSIVKFRPKTNGTVNTEEGGIPRGIKSDQDWIAETPVGDWFYAPGFTNDSGAVIRYLLEEVSRDGNVGLCICPLPDGSLDKSTIKMLKETGEWMRINGSGIYGSKAWTRLGEGANGKLNVLPGGKIGGRQAAHKFAASDIRFTVGKDKNLYAYCMTVPATGTELRINSLGSSANALGAPVKSVSLLGYSGSLIWKQEADALVVSLPDTSAFKTALGFKIETK
jgi:alpha-L-fucosidase